ncbi:methionyl-tRNA formyltransferase [Maribacter algarum]|uniref:Methionyl-tRNA formyltransferase n=1 Tax=Maribacter algarum (ex Zhang et al. 2020) TaxID=2578118 RepID=A0A5S3PS41_9FLAO|nr:methionyl-tRNA formyltransferase [Maribacter algarum]TMM57550.1 methionyl-tRNA formyltransferase [Maribacter algarum]
MNLSKREKLRIVFMGTPDFAVATLSTLVKNGYDVVGVITAPDRPAGRGRKLQESVVKKYAIEKGLTILQPTNLKNVEFLAELGTLKANLQIVVAFRMLPKAVWEMPEYGTFNLHASLLPSYRGAAPINWAIINGETETGVTTFFIDDKIDTGEIILQEKVKITEDDTAGTLHDKLMDVGADLVLTTVQQIGEGVVKTQKQIDTKELKSAYKIFKETCEINWKKPINDIYNHIRGLSPYPASWTTLQNGDDSLFLKVYHATIEKEKHNLVVGTVLFDKTELKVVVEGGYINLLEIQLPGKRKMKTTDVLNGLKLLKSAHVL